MAVKGGRGCHHDDDAALRVRARGRHFGEVLEGLADEVDGASEVDVENEVEVVQAKGLAIAIKNLSMKSAYTHHRK